MALEDGSEKHDAVLRALPGMSCCCCPLPRQASTALAGQGAKGLLMVALAITALRGTCLIRPLLTGPLLSWRGLMDWPRLLAGGGGLYRRC